ncbi:acyltransferase [Acaryochloris marina]|uniref:Carbon dioxide concentrating mechanism protein n=1 Tax=Acaryochloris marina (strain MBIC 11017) TaxID=329726 RepID=B0CBU0_ACAM1|nr:hypothetical protein [Acaryochloris marina]ABW30340.1 conserved hypothetical protein [Acaryochloris marina MBIC11017]
MQLSPPQPVSTSQFCVIGDVTIHPHAKIAPGVILQAAPQSKIVIGASACIGIGAVIQAFDGTITVESNAVLGAGVLVLGKATIGVNACIGDCTTIINTDIVTQQVIPEGSLMGDASRSTIDESPNRSPFDDSLPSTPVNTAWPSSPPPIPNPTPASPPQRQSHVIGRAYVTQMLQVLFARNSSPYP